MARNSEYDDLFVVTPGAGGPRVLRLKYGDAAKPVWYKCRYFGWDEERLIAVFDNTFDELRAAPGVLFWHNE